MSDDAPIYTEIREAHKAILASGQIQGRNEMKHIILELARAIKNPGAQVRNLITAIEHLNIKQ